MIDPNYFESELNRIGKEQAQFVAQTIENYLKLRIEGGDKIEDITQGYEKDGLVRIFVHNQLVATFKFESKVVEGENSTFHYITNAYRKDY